MPPLKGIDRGLDGTALKALEEIGHGSQIVIVDPSYQIPDGAHVIDYHGESSARALDGILSLVPIEKIHGHDVTCMAPDSPLARCPALEAFEIVALSRSYTVYTEARNQDPNSKLSRGFYAEANNPERTTLFVRIRDQLAYACARIMVGHTQE